MSRTIARPRTKSAKRSANPTARAVEAPIASACQQVLVAGRALVAVFHLDEKGEMHLYGETAEFPLARFGEAVELLRENLKGAA